MTQALSASGATFVRLHEGFVAKYYLDPVGVPTIGIGFTWRSAAFRAWWAKHKNVEFGPGATITRAEAEDALRALFAEEYGLAVNKFLGEDVAQHVFDAMSSVTFNCGAGTLGDRWALAAKAGNYGAAGALLEATRVTARGKRLAGLVRRRKEEALLLEKGIYTGVGGAVQPEPADAMADGMLIRGERGPAVRILIVDLHKLGFYDGRMDDVFGYGTEAAVLAFQRTNGLEADGWAGPVTLKAIAAAIGKPASTVTPPPATPTTPAPQDAPVAPADRPWWIVLLEALARLFTRG